MKSLTAFAVATLALVCAPTFATAQAVELKPHFLPGKIYHQSIRMQQTTQMNMGGQVMDQNVTSLIESTMKVTADPKTGGMKVAQKYDRISMNMDMAGQKMGFDSNSPDANDPLGMGKTLGAMTKIEVRMLLDANGKVTDIENLDELSKPLADANPMSGQMVKAMFSKENIAQGINEGSLKALPGKPVNAGDKWDYQITQPIPQMGQATIKGTYTVKGMAERGGARCVEITEVGQVGMDLSKLGAAAGADNADALQKLGMTMTGGSLQGTTYFDPALGMAREATYTQAFKIQMANTPEIPMTQMITIKLTGVEDAK